MVKAPTDKKGLGPVITGEFKGGARIQKQPAGGEVFGAWQKRALKASLQKPGGGRKGRR